ncbi:MAG: glycosyltransferase family 4 protein [Clostridiales bacterium]|nr:glycosyltransferase family 4 protein [Clostridiales bacterium]
MNILFLSLYEIANSNSGYIYADLVREFVERGHNVYTVTPTRKEDTCAFTDDNGAHIIKVKNGQIQKTGKIKKVINLLSLEKHTIKAVKKFANGVKFDLIVNMCSNLCYAKTSMYFKKRDGAIYYLLMKDIFPQNAVDIGMMKTSGIMGFVYRHFRKKEKKMYSSTDYIGCMSKANKDYILSNNPQLNSERITIVPNSIQSVDVALSDEDIKAMRDKYGIPQDKTVFVYGGNLGKPQDIPFIIECLKAQEDNASAYFFIVGDGTEFNMLQNFVDTEKPNNVKLLQRLPREDFDGMLAACDVGMIFLDYRFTVPNFPSRLLSYMQAGLPVLACTDANTDVGNIIVDNNFGWKCASNDVQDFTLTVKQAIAEANDKKDNSKKLLNEEFSVAACYETISRCFE